MYSALTPAAQWLRLQTPEFERFMASCDCAEKTQADVLASYVASARNTAFGKAHGFGGMRDYEDYRRSVPLHRYEDLEPWIQRCLRGERDVLVPGAVDRFALTSGTDNFSKTIPHPAPLMREFEGAVAAWMVTLHRDHPAAFAGRWYWSLSPPLQGQPIFSNDDLDYFSPDAAACLKNMFAVSPHVVRMQEPAAFYKETLSQLLACENLSFVSVWSPSFFLQLDRMLRTIVGRDFLWQDLWPRLAVLSCWTDAQSAMWMDEVRERLGPSCAIQGKGLLSTEGVVSMPVAPGMEPVLAIRAHFYEFLDVANDAPRLPGQVEPGRDYEVVLTTAGGLYRYRTSDVVRVTGFFRPGVPHLRFMGRTGRQSDLIGEKINEYQVVRSVEEAAARLGTRAFDLLLLCPSDRSYLLCLRPRSSLSPDQLQRFATQVDEGLQRNPYYRQAIALGQLDPVEYTFLSEEQSTGLVAHFRKKHAMKDGELKLPMLWRGDEMPMSFREALCPITARK